MSTLRTFAVLSALVVFTPGCLDVGSATAEVEASAFDRYELDWVLADDGTYVLRADLAIDAPPDVVWALVRDVNGYEAFSDTIHAHADEVVPGGPIELGIQLFDPPFGHTRSLETIYVVDDEVRAIAWQRHFALNQTTERWQIVVPEGDGSRYYTALKFPWLLGSIMKITLGPRTLEAFEAFAAELGAEASRLAP